MIIFLFGKYNITSLEYRETKGTTTDTDNVVVDGGDKELIFFIQEGGGFGRQCWFWYDRNIGELAVVSGTHGVELDEIEGVGVGVETTVLWDSWGVVVWVDEGEVIRTHS